MYRSFYRRLSWRHSPHERSPVPAGSPRLCACGMNGPRLSTKRHDRFSGRASARPAFSSSRPVRVVLDQYFNHAVHIVPIGSFSGFAAARAINSLSVTARAALAHPLLDPGKMTERLKSALPYSFAMLTDQSVRFCRNGEVPGIL